MTPTAFSRRLRTHLGLFEVGAVPYTLLTRHADWSRQAARLADVLPPRVAGRPLRVLDVGTGPANSALAIASAAGHAHVVGLDFSRAMLRRACEAVREAEPVRQRVSLLRGDAHALCVRSGSVDAVTGHSLLYLLHDREAALAEFRRVLRPGGRLVLMEPRAGIRLGHLGRVDNPVHVLTMALWRLVSSVRGRFDEPGLRALATRAGFHPLSVTPVVDGLGLLLVAEAF